jgi:cysteine desulfurase
VSLIYLDHNATTPTDRRVVEAMEPFYTESFGNPASPYTLAERSRRAVDEARRSIAGILGAPPASIVFTAGGSESDNMALKGVALGRLGRAGHVVTSAIEHHAVLHTCEYLRDRLGLSLTVVGVDGNGLVDPVEVADACRDETVLISIMYVNNEVGVVEPIREIAREARRRGILFHSDAVQAIGKIPVDVEDVGADFLAMSGHKFYGPKGVGALYVRPGAGLDPLVHGGGQESGWRSGTVNVPGVVGLARALEIATCDMASENERLSALVRRLEAGIVSAVPSITIHGAGAPRVPGTTNIAFHFVEGESIVLALDMEGIEVSTGSACTSDSAEPSHVLSAMGVPPNTAQGSVRFGLGRHTTTDEIDRVLSVLPGIVARLRSMSPLYRPTG